MDQCDIDLKRMTMEEAYINFHIPISLPFCSKTACEIIKIQLAVLLCKRRLETSREEIMNLALFYTWN